MIKRWGKWSVDMDEYTISLEIEGRLRIFTIPPRAKSSPDEVFDWIVRPGERPWLESGDLADLRSALDELLGVARRVVRREISPAAGRRKK